MALTPEEDLLREWFLWWLESEEAPVKMPNALHVRTALYFTGKYKEALPTDGS